MMFVVDSFALHICIHKGDEIIKFPKNILDEFILQYDKESLIKYVLILVVIIKVNKSFFKKNEQVNKSFYIRCTFSFAKLIS